MIPVIQSLRIRDEVLKKTNGKCAYCGKGLFVSRRGNAYDEGLEPLAVDHVVPRVHGGGDSLENLLPSCKRCNSTKDRFGVDEFRRRAWAQSLNEKTGQRFSAGQWEWIRENAHKIPIDCWNSHVFYHEHP